MTWLSCIISNALLAGLLATTAWIVQRWMRQYWVARILWIMVLIKLVTPPFIQVPLHHLSGPLACVLGVCACGNHVPVMTGDALPWVFVAAWMIGAAATGSTAWLRWTRFRRLLKLANPAPPEWQALAKRLSSQISLDCMPELLAAPAQLPPLVIAGRTRPRLLLPAGLMHQLDAPQREALLLHELIHIKRRDHWVRLLELAVNIVYWWLPGLGFIGRKLRDCEESCCDAAVLAHLPHARRDYARLLLEVLDFVSAAPPGSVAQATAMSAAHDLERRLLTILHGSPKPRRSWIAASIVFGAACTILPCQLHIGLLTQPIQPSASVARQSAPGFSFVPDGNGESAPSIMCCP